MSPGHSDITTPLEQRHQQRASRPQNVSGRVHDSTSPHSQPEEEDAAATSNGEVLKREDLVRHMAVS